MVANTMNNGIRPINILILFCLFSHKRTTVEEIKYSERDANIAGEINA